MTEIELMFQMDMNTAWELAQFAKRLGFQTCYDLTEAHLSREERLDKAYRMIQGIALVADALARVGISPR